MNAQVTKATRRQLRKLLGSAAEQTVVETAYDFKMFMRRGLVGRLKWLFFGR